MNAYWDAMEDGFRIGLEVDIRMFYLMAKAQASSENGIRDKIIAEQWKETKRLSPVQLLQIAQETLIEDDPYLHFDYHEFSQRCIDWLHQASSCFLIETRKLPIMSTYPLSYSVVHAVLWEAAMAEMREISSERTALHRIGSLVNAFTEAARSHCTTRSLEISGSHLSDHRKPSVLHPNHLKDVESQDSTHINYADNPPGGSADSEWYAKSVHPDEEKLVRWGYQKLTEAMDVQGLDAKLAAEHVEGIMVERYRASSVMKRPLIRVENGVAVITTRAWTHEEISETVAQMDPKLKEMAMRLGVHYM